MAAHTYKYHIRYFLTLTYTETHTHSYWALWAGPPMGGGLGVASWPVGRGAAGAFWCCSWCVVTLGLWSILGRGPPGTRASFAGERLGKGSGPSSVTAVMTPPYTRAGTMSAVLEVLRRHTRMWLAGASPGSAGSVGRPTIVHLFPLPPSIIVIDLVPST